VDTSSAPPSYNPAPMPPEFALSEDALDDDRHVVAVRGEIDLFTAPELKQKLTDAIEGGKSRIVVDLTETSFLDSTALGVLIGAVKRLRSRDGALVIVNVDQNIAKTFEITGLDQIFTIVGTRDEAVAALDQASSPQG
jgi:anti-sigma B factor antagonist